MIGLKLINLNLYVFVIAAYVACNDCGDFNAMFLYNKTKSPFLSKNKLC